MIAPESVDLARVAWAEAIRIVPSRHPPVAVFDLVADEAELESLFRVEGETNARLAEEMGGLERVPRADRLFGPGTTPIMAAFTHPGEPTRFSDGSYGVYYCARDELTARRETRFHRARFARENRLPSMGFEMREYVGPLHADLHDLRGLKRGGDPVLDPNDYSAGQALARTLREGDSWGIVYDSVRDERDLPCAAVFRPPVLSPVQQRRHLVYEWDGHEITAMRSVEDLAL